MKHPNQPIHSVRLFACLTLLLAWSPLVRAAAFTPSNVSGLVLWLDAGTGVTKDGGNQVLQWNDQSTSGFNVKTNGVAGNGGPTFVAAGINGKPALDFSVANFPRLQNSTATLSTPNGQRTVFVVAEANSTTDPGMYFAYSNGGPFLSYHPFNPGSGTRLFVDANESISNNPLATVAQPFVSAVGMTGAGGLMQVDLNGTTQAVTQTFGGIPADGSAGFMVGAVFSSGQHWDGLISEVLVYNHLLNNTDLNNVGFYLSQKYGVATSFQEIVPEPSTALLLGVGGWLIRRRLSARRGHTVQ